MTTYDEIGLREFKPTNYLAHIGAGAALLGLLIAGNTLKNNSENISDFARDVGGFTAQIFDSDSRYNSAKKSRVDREIADNTVYSSLVPYIGVGSNTKIIDDVSSDINTYSICNEGDHVFKNGVLTGPLVENGGLEGTLDALYDISYGDEVSGCSLKEGGLDNASGLVKYMEVNDAIDPLTTKEYLYDIDGVKKRLSL